MFVSLRSPAAFLAVYRTGTRSRRGGLLVLQARGLEGSPRLGFVAGKKVGNAVQRNRAKRRMREAARRVDLPSGFDVVLVATADVNTAAFPTLVGWLSDALEANRMKIKGKRQ